MSSPGIAQLAVADAPATWRALGFAVDGEVCRIGGVCVRLTGSTAGRGLIGWSLRGVVNTVLDGLPTTLAANEPFRTAGVHPNGVIAIDHVVVMTPVLRRSIEALQGAGLDLRRIREEPTPAGAPRQAFFRLGAEILEVVQEPQEILERAGGADRPARFWGLALLVEDLEATRARMSPHVGEPRVAVQPGRRIATLRRSAGLSVPLALMSAVESPAVPA